ncbi:MAG TPA: RidA family protein [Acidimicrobiia bacterium]|jgi:enamine deaminase RidA (YjgF/YER057c/UK114 family)|nr:RidA family protein [Acidimicrobiia bacterium]HIL06962.1 RidA family protein [Acidimicrobiia bacterium]
MAGTVIRSRALEDAHPHPEMIRSGAFSAGMKAGPFLYVSGCIAGDLTKDMAGQAREEFSFIELVVKEAGYALTDVVKLQAFITDPVNYPAYSAVRKEFFPKDPPASTAVVTGLLIPEALIEIDVVAYKVDE